MNSNRSQLKQFGLEHIGRISSFADILRFRAADHGSALAYSFLGNRPADDATISYQELDRKALAIAAALRDVCRPGDRALLVYPPGLDYIAAFFGCLYAGVIAVPVYPPRPNQSLTRLNAVAVDCGARVGLSQGETLKKATSLLEETQPLSQLLWLSSDIIDAAGRTEKPPVEVGGKSLAFLQYTSGSTGSPKGVMVSHENLLQNSMALADAFAYDRTSHCVSWLPMYHDMGLIGGVLQPLYGGFPCTLLPPVSFLQRPAAWLEAISEHGATISGGPNFAYELCVRKISSEERAGLDLRCWSVAFNGSEPVRSCTLESFASTFEACGFRREALYPCYGLAEATLFVSGGRAGSAAPTWAIEKQQLKTNKIVSADETLAATRLVSCGTTRDGHIVAIVDPKSGRPCPADQVGEIWVSGPSVTLGYWNRVTDTAATFEARVTGSGQGPFLRTGDLGCLREGELFITGRLKDVIVIRGLNHYPQDIEATVESSCADLRKGCGAAFSLDVMGEEQVVIVQEVATSKDVDWGERIGIIREAVWKHHDLQPYAIALVRSGSLPKTSSGKSQRFAVRDDFLNGRLKLVLEWRASLSVEPAAKEHQPRVPADRDGILRWVSSCISIHLRISESEIEVSRPVMSHGLDSISAIQLVHAIEVGLGISLPVTSLLQGITPGQIAEAAWFQRRQVEGQGRKALCRSPNGTTDYPLSFGQRALWYMHQVAPERPVYNIAAALRIKETCLDTSALARAVQIEIGRHPCLRTVFYVVEGQPFQRVLEQMENALSVEEDHSLTQEEFDINLLEQAYRPFDLEKGPLFRWSLYSRQPDDHVLLISTHHIVSDFWSLGVIAHELGMLYDAEVTGVGPVMRPVGSTYADFVESEARLIESADGEALWNYWRNKLEGDLPVLDLPTDKPRRAQQGWAAQSYAFKFGGDLTTSLKALSRSHNVTLYTALLALFQSLLFRYSMQEDILVGSPVAIRDWAEVSGLVGYFVNPLIMRGDFSSNPSIESLLPRTHSWVVGALEHKAFPFSLLIEKLQPVRHASHSPLFQVVFMFQKSQIEGDTSLARLALGEGDASVHLGTLQAESISLPRPWTEFDLTLVVADLDSELGASIEFNSELFEAETIRRLADHFVNLVTSAVQNQGYRVTDLDLLGDADRFQLVTEWNDTRCAYRENLCVHQAVEMQSETAPDAVALVLANLQLSFRGLNERANQVARYVAGAGAGPEIPVGICVERSVEMAIYLLGIMKSGAAYVPIDPSYPIERIKQIVSGASIKLLMVSDAVPTVANPKEMTVIRMREEWTRISAMSNEDFEGRAGPDNMAYVIFTSGSTGKPKGVMISHRSVLNFFRGMDSAVGCGKSDTLVAVTSISFDISVLEIFWTLSRGVKVILKPEPPSATALAQPRRSRAGKPINLSVFYFASNDSSGSEDKYRLLFEGAKLADRIGMEAVWTPERHFHAFGGLFPNPSLTSAALAVLTKRIHIRAGSVVLPLHDPIRVAEEWSLVDNLSNGRVGIAFASGWHADDFAFFPERYHQRKEVMFDAIETVKKLWHGESVTVKGGAGNEIEVRIFPQPRQAELPVWITAAGASETFVKAGQIGANILTHLLGQTVEHVAGNIKLYREALASGGKNPTSGRVTMMLHTFVGKDRDAVRDAVRQPFSDYLRSSVGLVGNMVRSLALPLDLERMSEKDMDDLIAFAFDRYFETSALFGDKDDCLRMIDQMKGIGVDEIACLCDFGVDTDLALAAMENLRELQDVPISITRRRNAEPEIQPWQHLPTLMQCTPSVFRMLMLDTEAVQGLRSLNTLLLGGEALPGPLVQELQSHFSCRTLNMYGPTETTIWSAVAQVAPTQDIVSIGRPISNTEIHVVNGRLQPVPVGVHGELCIAGDGLARGYWAAPELTAEKFVPDPLGGRVGGRLYKTGDTASRCANGTLNFLGRFDQQVKIRGHRVELGEISAILADHSLLREAVVVTDQSHSHDNRLVAYVAPVSEPGPTTSELREFLRRRLPEHMVPSGFITLSQLPLTANGKVNRKALPRPGEICGGPSNELVRPRSSVERVIADAWATVLKTNNFGVYDNFFDLGGHSLLMAQVHSILSQQFNKALPLIMLLEHPTISTLARYLTAQHEQDRVDANRARAARQRGYLIRGSKARERVETL